MPSIHDLRQIQVDNNTHRGFSQNPTNTNSNANNNTSIVTIKFGDDNSHLHKLSQQKIKRRLTNTFNVVGD